ncbi:MAG: hypothetical protein ACOX8R_05150 [Bacillota bacterium]
MTTRIRREKEASAALYRRVDSPDCVVYPNEHCATCPLERPLGGCDYVELITAAREKRYADL